MTRRSSPPDDIRSLQQPPEEHPLRRLPQVSVTTCNPVGRLLRLAPSNAADETGCRCVPDATPYVKKSIAENPILFPDEATLAKVEFEKFLGNATADWAKAWEEFKSA